MPLVNPAGFMSHPIAWNVKTIHERSGQFRDTEDQIRRKFQSLSPRLDERQLRLWPGAKTMALALGLGEIAAGARATEQGRAHFGGATRSVGVASSTVRNADFSRILISHSEQKGEPRVRGGTLTYETSYGSLYIADQAKW